MKIEESQKMDYLTKPLDSVLYENESELEGIELVLPEVKHCSRFCKEECDDFLSSLSDDEILAFKSQFGVRKKDFKTRLLQYITVQEKVQGVSQYGVVFNNHLFCPNAFSFLTGKSLYLIKKVLKDSKNGVVNYFHGDKKKAMPPATVYFIAWLLVFGCKYGQVYFERCFFSR